MGSDQVAKTERAAIGLEAYHAFEMRDGDFDKVQYRINAFTQEGTDTIIIFISPQSLKQGT